MNTFSRAFLFTFVTLMTLTACDSRAVSYKAPAKGTAEGGSQHDGSLETLPFLDDILAADQRAAGVIERSRPGTSTRRRSLRPGDASIMARFLIAEAARQPEAELRAIIGVIRARYDSGRYGSTVLDVLLYNRDGTWAFTAADPRRANGELLWGAGVVGSRRHHRMLAIIHDEWTKASPTPFDHYWHPDAMIGPRTPRWAVGKPAVRIGDAMFCACGR